ncbi:hypothetical protein GCM10028803_36400 [Larkinella knui]|uniref:DUF3592 domain-containing protein n=1 Tax=Larkinella knui TaxID=2025310 RepID=A0A3P1CE49_9BACT|nr:hypothetical protein [Larkinella knui]RRB11500.1 hypothetical protein EHT87_23780 [Larkinella knui]
MKIGLFILLLSIGPVAMARSVVQTRLVDNGKTLTIQISGHRDGRKIHFDQTFDVSNQNILQKERIKYRAFRSVGLVPPVAEFPGLITAAVGLVALAGTALAVWSQNVKIAAPRPI